MTAVAAALGYQPWGSPPVEEMGDDGEEGTGWKMSGYGGIRGEEQRGVGILPGAFNLSWAPEKGAHFIPQRFSGAIQICCFTLSSWSNVLINVVQIISQKQTYM